MMRLSICCASHSTGIRRRSMSIVSHSTGMARFSTRAAVHSTGMMRVIVSDGRDSTNDLRSRSTRLAEHELLFVPTNEAHERLADDVRQNVHGEEASGCDDTI